MSNPPRARSWFTARERAYLDASKLGRMATLGRDGSPQVKPVSIHLPPDRDIVIVMGHDLDRSAKWRNLDRDPRVAIVIDHLGDGTYSSVNGIEIRGTATLANTTHPAIAIHPYRILAWNLPRA